MRLSYRQEVCEYLRNLTDVDEIIEHMDALNDALGCRALMNRAAVGVGEDRYKKDLRDSHFPRTRYIAEPVCLFAHAEKSLGDLREIRDNAGEAQ